MESKRSFPGRNVLYDVKCVKGHVFPKLLEIEEDSGSPQIPEMETYCPHCDSMVMVSAGEKTQKDDVIKRGLPGKPIVTAPRPEGNPPPPTKKPK